ncbi:LysR substrate-binding domain-containing protein [Burkholderia sp. MR1-5-21]
MPRPLTFHQIEAFYAVVVSGTTVAAARMLNTTQPSISRLITQAQSASGLKLFVNDRGRLQLTREGRHLFDTVERYFQGFEQIEKSIASLRESGTGIFRIASTPSLGQSILPSAMKRFAAIFPNVTYTVATLGSREIAEGLRLGRYDIAVTNTRFDGEEFSIHQVAGTDAVCVCALDHEFAKLETVQPETLAEHSFISLPSHDELTMKLRDVMQSRSLTLRTIVETIYSSTICAMVKAGLGVSVVNPYMAAAFAGQLCIRPFEPKIGISTYAIFSRYAPASELAERFLHELALAMRDVPHELPAIDSL